MTASPSRRPELQPSLRSQEFQRWYWLKEELIVFARTLGIKTSGSKKVLTARITATLEGRKFVEPPSTRTASKIQLTGELTAGTIIPTGQRCSQLVRRWMASQLGGNFKFDAHMRDFFAQSDGTKTLQDAVDHWHATRNVQIRDIDPQFEYNQFTREWYANHPEGSRRDLLAAWKQHRALPIDERS